MKINKKVIIGLVATLVLVLGIGASVQAVKIAEVNDQLKLGNKYLSDGTYENAILAFSKAIELDPKNVEARLALVEALVKSGKANDAEKVLLDGIKIVPENPQLYLKTALFYLGQGRVNDAIDTLDIGYAKTKDKELDNELQTISGKLSVGGESFIVRVAERVSLALVYKGSDGKAIPVKAEWSAKGQNGKVTNNSDGTGVFEGLTAGTETVQAKAGSITKTQNYDVRKLTLIEIQTEPSSGKIGSQIQLKAIGKDQNGDSIDISPNWSLEGEIGKLSVTAGSTNVLNITQDGVGKVTAKVGDVSAAVELVVDKPIYSISTSTSGQGTITKNPNVASDQKGAVITFSAQPAEGWTFVRWEGSVTGSANPVKVTLDGNKSLKAVFEPQYFTLTTSTQGQGQVTRTVQADKYAFGTRVVLTAAPKANWAFDHWEGDLSGNNTSATIELIGNKSVQAVFVQTAFNVTTSVQGEGTVNKSPAKTSYQYGESVILIASPSPGWLFDHWIGDAAGNTASVSVTLTGDKNVTAVFVPQPVIITTSVQGEGVVHKSPDQSSYQYGQAITLMASPSPGWLFDHWTGDVTGNTPSVSVTLTGDKNVQAIFVPQYFTLTTVTSGEGTVTRDVDASTYSYGTQVTLTAVPTTGWAFDYWEIDGLIDANPSTTVTMDSDHFVNAVFYPQPVALTISVKGEGVVYQSPDGSVHYYGESVMLYASPTPGWVFDHWEGDVTDTVSSINLLLNGDKNVTAVFVPENYTLTTMIAGEGQVTRDVDAATYANGTQVTLTATPATGWVFDHWEVDLTSTNPSETIIMDNNKIVNAVFVQQTFSVTTGVQGGGAVYKSPDQLLYPYGDSVMLIASPNPGWVFDHWEGDATGTVATVSIMLTSNKTVLAVFVQAAAPTTYTVTTSAVGQGLVIVSPQKTAYLAGDQVTFSTSPDPGWIFDHYEGDIAGTADPVTVTITNNMNVTAVFVQQSTGAVQNIMFGTVTDSQSTYPIQGATITLTDIFSGITVATVTTDANGYYEIVNPAPGSYNQHVSAIAYLSNLQSVSYTSGPLQVDVSLVHEAIPMP